MNREDQLLNRSEIIRMALEAELIPPPLDWPQKYAEALERFAAIVAAASASVEREACAQVCDEYSAVGKIEEFDRGWVACAKAISNVIRARGETSSRGQT